MKKFVFCALIVGGMILYSPKLNAAGMESESQSSIHFIKGDSTEEINSESDNEQIGKIDDINDERTFPQTGEKNSNNLKGIGIALVGLVIFLTKIKKREEDLL